MGGEVGEKVSEGAGHGKEWRFPSTRTGVTGVTGVTGGLRNGSKVI